MTLVTFCTIVAALEFLIGLPMVVAPAAAAQWMIRFVRDEITYRLTGVLLVAMGAAALAHDCVFSTDVAGVVRLMALLTAVKGVFVCWWPGHHVRIVDAVLSSPMKARLIGIFAVCVGLLFAAAAQVLRTST